MSNLGDFPWNEDLLVKKIYNCDNYRVENTGSKTGRAIIFFSSNGLYYPNDKRVFENTVISNDRYEWRNLAKHPSIRLYYEKIVYIRDIYKQWYVLGINNRLDSIDKIAFFLKEELRDYRITTCGSSAGGYMAVCIGELLDVERIFTNYGQFDLWIHNNPGPYIELYKYDNTKNNYFNLRELIDNKKNNIFYFYQGESEQDIRQSKSIEECKVNKFIFEGNGHGPGMKAICLPYLLSMTNDELEKLCDIYDGKVINKDEFYCRVVPKTIQKHAHAFFTIKDIARKLPMKIQNIIYELWSCLGEKG